MNDGNGWNFVIKDHLGSTRVIMNQNNQVTSSYHYSPFGEIMYSTNGNNLTYQYTGQEKDEEFGLHNFRARMYDSQLKKFYSVDPMEHFEWSPYNYCFDNPINLSDFSGMDAATAMRPSPSDIKHWTDDGLQYDSDLIVKSGGCFLPIHQGVNIPDGKYIGKNIKNYGDGNNNISQYFQNIKPYDAAKSILTLASVTTDMFKTIKAKDLQHALEIARNNDKKLDKLMKTLGADVKTLKIVGRTASGLILAIDIINGDGKGLAIDAGITLLGYSSFGVGFGLTIANEYFSITVDGKKIGGIERAIDAIYKFYQENPEYLPTPGPHM
jgi:RHS repeat-associated protein